MSRTRFITYDQLNVELEAKYDLAPNERREVLKFARHMREHAQDYMSKIIPEHLEKHIKIKIT